MHIHILGICGTFMGSLAQLAKASGHRVTGSDANVYPPMSTQLEAAGIELISGFDPDKLALNPDIIVVGNVVSRGNPVMEEVLNRGLPYMSGPQWLAENILQGKWVLGVSGTHGKTTTSSMLAWILEYAGMSPGYLIGGVPGNFTTSARLGDSDFFVIEADEYDTAFFDKRSKFVHYKPRTLVVNNLEFDHADIFANLEAIQTQFHHVVRTVPQVGMVIHHGGEAVAQVIEKGCWCPVQEIGSHGDWGVKKLSNDGSSFDVIFGSSVVGTVHWDLLGDHNVQNALSAIAAARHVGVEPHHACEALSKFVGVKRRMELLATVGECFIYDDFAHHPTAIETTLAGLRAKVGGAKVIAIIEPRSNTMKQGYHKDALLSVVKDADEVYWYQDTDLSWSLEDIVSHEKSPRSKVFFSIEDILEEVSMLASGEETHIVIMSNGGFQGIHSRVVDAIQT